MNEDARLAELKRWLSRFAQVAGGDPVPASSDASFRRYFRVGGARTLIAMDAPPAREDCRPFVTVAGFLRDIGVHVPEVLEADFEQGFLLLTDLGTRPYLAALEDEPETADRLYGDALDTLRRIQVEGQRFREKLPAYDADRLRTEAELFREWLCGRHLGLRLMPSEDRAWRDAVERLVEDALSQPAVFVHRDYHSRNLMVTATDNPGVIDFQDAMSGPLTYDLVSLLKDCYIRWPVDVTKRRALAYFNSLPESLRGTLDDERFLSHFHLMGIQRHLKASGIFARLWHRDGKRGYLPDVPRTLCYIVEAGRGRDGVDGLAAFIDERVLPALAAAQ